MKILEKIGNLPKRTRKITLWLAVILIGLSLMIWWIKNLQKRLEGFKSEEFKKELKFPSFEEELKKMPELEMPQINEEEK